MKRVSRTRETIIGVEVVREPIEVQVPTLAIEIEIRDVAVAIRVLPDHRTKCCQFHCSLNTLRAVFYLGPVSPLTFRTK
ncbi:MAG: hypothetical protein UX24_C0002G0012 [Candidatus Giovannonibacteria bacterium GW2011_GWB1_45_9b]|uniref:Uncharacterized protein n=5 Tax=Candidatus Giovannoniibacteriota TaxID=1752738 RepID=A0A1F5WZY7_9BACT|nr:MAG: hypothetical protein UX24_C0002G0012 [Candidatus Giovannonibacteria bacterium GW2011_GWB1_45_9b]OGF73443.1 MAG: hypothetical protein A2W57_00430 [Candidatus Giovannonibacteria bacterium RIFCSPHIGHO2_02_43_16]OGF81179.1 MAG: hypothetical protein A2W48_01435 [Candidatus Giovannonibacteria bacterium RIFCSPHIGHO2_12_44_12]OGF86077.1 MAG: hypothetical protein A2Z63_03255 [Candidatus Giovannonibacteria bacterium RIFCSPLOWO2_02_44_8]OGF95619.1 MAG: hypothetical protein A2Y47_02780 [Candidatus 